MKPDFNNKSRGYNSAGDTCSDNRFELIEKYKQKLISGTNIETSKEEMDVIDSIFFRLWQMGWLDILEEHYDN